MVRAQSARGVALVTGQSGGDTLVRAQSAWKRGGTVVRDQSAGEGRGRHWLESSWPVSTHTKDQLTGSAAELKRCVDKHKTRVNPAE